MTLSISLLLVSTLAAQGPLTSGDHEREIEVDGRTRSYLLHIPKNYDGSKPFPVVLCFHGGGSNARQQMAFCGLNRKSESAGFIAVYPNGTGNLKRVLTWNSGNCCGYAARRQVDDVAFVDALLDELDKLVKVDAKRVYATGMSNGGMMSYTLADKLSNRIAAIAPVAGPMGTVGCSPDRPVSVIHFHGTKDEYAPFDGGRGAKSLGSTTFYSVEHSINNWAKVNGCEKTPRVEQLAYKTNDGMRVSKKTFANGRDGSEVVLVGIENGGHTWPGQRMKLKALGPATRDISANDMMWDFFERHPMK